MGSEQTGVASLVPPHGRDDVGEPPSTVRSRLKPKRDALTRVRHDLRSLVHSVIGYSDLLASRDYGTLTADQARFVDQVRSAAEQLHEMVDTCIELSRPSGEKPPADSPAVALIPALQHVCAGLAGEAIRCALTVPPELERHARTLELPSLLKAIKCLARVITRDGTLRCSLHAELRGERVQLTFLSEGARSDGATLQSLDALENDVGNREFVRLKLCEVLLAKLDIELTLTAELDAAQLTLR